MDSHGTFLPTDPHFSTKAIHVAYDPRETSVKGVVPPINLSTTYHQPDFLHPHRYLYARKNNPTREILEKTLAVLENGKFASCFASGMAAITMAVNLTSPGDHVLCVANVYGGTYKYFKDYSHLHGITYTYADVNDMHVLEANLLPNTKLVWLECLTNPLMTVIDVVSISRRVRELNPNAYILVDNSFLSPYFARPLDLGAHMSLSSLTKYINGHSDVLMGTIVTNDEQIYAKMRDFQEGKGAVPSAFDCYLALRGLKTMSVRMKQHMCAGYQVAKFLETHPAIELVLYAGLETHPRHEIALQQWHGCGGMLSFRIKGTIEEVKVFLNNLRYISTGLSYGGYESVIEVSKYMSQKHTPPEECDKMGITDTLLRLSVGLEEPEDLVNDLKGALDCIVK